MAGSFLIAVGFFVARKAGHPVVPHVALVLTVAATTAIWLAVTYMTSPTDREKLLSFYRLVRPAGPGWRSIRAQAGLLPSPDSMPQAMLGWALGCLFVYAALFGTGSALYGRTAQAALWIALFVLSGAGLIRLLPRLWSGREA
jgi:SSS family solute:Na+ symporter